MKTSGPVTGREPGARGPTGYGERQRELGGIADRLIAREMSPAEVAHAPVNCWRASLLVTIALGVRVDGSDAARNAARKLA